MIRSYQDVDQVAVIGYIPIIFLKYFSLNTVERNFLMELTNRHGPMFLLCKGNFSIVIPTGRR